VEWAHEEVLADLVRLLDEHGVRATFFCTHANIQVPGHERALHPNFRRHGDALRALRDRLGDRYAGLNDEEVYHHVLEMTRTFCPEAQGVRAHSLYYDTQLLPLYQASGLQYDSSYCLPFVDGIRPFVKEHDILELPIYYMDHIDLMQQRSGFDLDALLLAQPGLKVFDFHPNLVYSNAPTCEHYERSKAFYRNPERLRAARHSGRGVRTLLLDLLDTVAAQRWTTATLGNVNTLWRQSR
jgi:peptidoglycan/xylan/chitin deacetylase (PgdA/CDA1 family)